MQIEGLNIKYNIILIKKILKLMMCKIIKSQKFTCHNIMKMLTSNYFGCF